jgi:hypothetical protein
MFILAPFMLARSQAGRGVDPAERGGRLAAGIDVTRTSFGVALAAFMAGVAGGLYAGGA